MSDPTAIGSETIHDLPVLPQTVRSITDAEFARLKSEDDGLWTHPSQNCRICNKSGTFRTRSFSEDVRTYRCNCIEQWRLHMFFLNAGIDLKYQRLSWRDAVGVAAEDREAVEDYRTHLDGYLDNGVGLTLYSSTFGTGKTMMATLLLKQALLAGHDGYFTRFNKMLDSYTASWRDDDQRLWFTRRIRNAKVLVIDDVGKENDARYGVVDSMMDEVIRQRVAACLTTWITLNLSVEEMKRRYPSSLSDLLTESNIHLTLKTAGYRPAMAQKLASDARDGLVAPVMLP